MQRLYCRFCGRPSVEIMCYICDRNLRQSGLGKLESTKRKRQRLPRTREPLPGQQELPFMKQ